MKTILFTLLFFSLATQAQKRKAITSVTLTTAKLSDSMRAQRAQMNILFWENKRLKERLDSAEIMTVNTEQFDIDENRVLSFKPEAFMIVPRPKDQQIKPSAAYKRAPLNDTVPIPQFSMPYKITTDPKDPKDQDIEDLKWQVKFLTSIIDGLYDIIDKQNRKLELLF